MILLKRLPKGLEKEPKQESSSQNIGERRWIKNPATFISFSQATTGRLKPIVHLSLHPKMIYDMSQTFLDV